LDFEEQLKRRVDEGTVARLLLGIATTPNRREQPNSGDLSGHFDFWFDGGAARVVTGRTEYEFEDGARAIRHGVPGLSVDIQLPNGCAVKVSQVTWELDKTFMKPWLG